MKKYMWGWYDGEGCYVNKADSMQEILETVLTYYFDPNEDGSECKVQVVETDGTFEISLQHEDGVERHEIEASEDTVIEFLNEIARNEYRPDMFGLNFM